MYVKISLSLWATRPWGGGSIYYYKTEQPTKPQHLLFGICCKSSRELPLPFPLLCPLLPFPSFPPSPFPPSLLFFLFLFFFEIESFYGILDGNVLCRPGWPISASWGLGLKRCVTARGWVFFIRTFILNIFNNVYNYVHIYAGRCWWKPNLSDPLGLELEVIVNCLIWMLGTELGSSGRAILTVYHWAILSTQSQGFFF